MNINVEQAIEMLWSDSEDDLSSSDFSSEDDSSDSSSEELYYEKHYKVSNFLNTIHLYSDTDFKKHLRLNRSTVQMLIGRYAGTEFFSNARNRGRKKVGAENEIYIFLWYIANTNSFREVANLFGITKSCTWRIVERVSSWLIKISHEFIKWPEGQQLARDSIAFERNCKIPGVLGCIDGSHIKIKAPSTDKESYFNRKRYYSVVLQAVVDSEKKFINVYCGEPGSLHDSRVLRRSSLYRKALENLNETFPNNTFLLGDSAYPCLDWLIPPFKDNGHLTTTQREFNRLHSSGRVIIENAFGLLKTRFRRILHFTEQIRINMVVNLVVAACVLHNICIVNQDEFDVEEALNESIIGLSDNSHQEISNINRRDRLINEMITKNVISGTQF